MSGRRVLLLKLLLASIFFLNLHADNRFPLLVSLDWLYRNLDDPDLVIVDVRNAKSYRRGHIRHAVNLPVFQVFFDKNLMLPKIDTLKQAFENAGISNHSKVVMYGGDQLIWAARGVWVGKLIGLERVGLLSVGYGNWPDGHIPVSTRPFYPPKGHFIPRIDNTIIETKLSTYLALGKKTIIDGRPPEYYRGEKSHAKRAGHIPGALNYPGSLNYIQKVRHASLKSLKELEQIYHDLPKNRPIILYCEDGADAALNFLVLKRLGYRVSVYEGSWLEWGNDPSLPIKKGSNP